MENPDTTLELSADDMRRLVEQTMAYIVPHIESLPQQPAVNVDDGKAVARNFVEPLPEKGQPFSELLELLFQRAIPTSFIPPDQATWRTFRAADCLRLLLPN